MPLPRSHMKSLNKHLKTHEERLVLLQQQMHALEVEIGRQGGSDQAAGKKLGPQWMARRRDLLLREVRIHESLMELGRNTKVLDALGELATNTEFAREAARDPKGAARQRGIELPRNMTLRLDVRSDQIILHIAYYEDLYPFLITWNNETGFSTPEARRGKPRRPRST